MKILIMADANSVHVYNFINIVLNDLNNIDITLLDMNLKEETNKEAYEYYKNKKNLCIIKTSIYNSTKNKMLKKIPRMEKLTYLYKLNSNIKKLGEFDYCLIHFVDRSKVLLSLINQQRFRRIIPIFWGSDLLRNKKIKSKLYYMLFKIAYKIIFNTENMLQQFKDNFRNTFDEKSEVIKFPVLSFSQIDEIEKKFTKEEMRKNMKLPQNKYIVICGHSGFKAEQHKQLINAISNCNKYVLNKCYFIFPMTYGEDDLKIQQKQVIDLLKKNNLEGKVLWDFLSKEEILQVMICSDIFISVITTDAFSAVMQENIYTKSVIIYGKWLNYYELDDNRITVHSIDEIDDITKTLENIILNIKLKKDDVEGNRELIYKISSPNVIRDFWHKKIFI